ncbi:hypothetical protein MYU51_014797 [Penicillium brevicompactum]|uniref:uncharacterized protein n=1 Tax=Penicillium brevicompactum TaxID=5074 RepID=UPI0025411D42|nr:uncharacterized protein N7506_007000 [Penicillium brevicompactum]KAJ5333217.1 hypothetical protein N7506_007000 [Penicillium brevicompactum]
MEPTKFTLPFRLVRDIWSPRGFDSDDSRLWLASFEGPAFINSFTVTFERTGYAAWVSLDPQLLSRFHVTTRTPANKWFFEDVSMLTFNRDQTDVHCIQVPVAGHDNPVLVLSAANLAGLAKRLHQFGRGKAFNQDWYGLTPTYDIHIKYSSTVGISFVNRMAIGQFNPSAFASSSDVRCLERLAGLEIWTDTKKADTASTDIVPIFYEECTGAGGGLGTGALSVGYEARKLNVGMVTPVGLLLPDIGPSGPVQSAVLCTYHSPVDKYNAMAEMLCEMCELGTQVLIIGDQPRALVHALLASGRNVINVSLENEEISTPTQESWGKYEQIRGEVFCDPDFRVVSDDQGLVVKFVGNFAAYVVDTSSHTESKISSTSKNIVIGQALKRNSPDVPVIVQLRDQPTIEVSLAILDLPGYSNQGCDSYGVLLEDNATNFGASPNDWQHFCWLRIHAGNNSGSRELKVNDQCYFQLSAQSQLGRNLMSPFFKTCQNDFPESAFKPGRHRRMFSVRGTPGDVYQSHLASWDHIIVTRAFMLAIHSSISGPECGLSEPKNPVEVLAHLEHNLGDYQSSRNIINSCFEITDVRQFTGTNPILFNRHPSIRHLVSARYDALARMCTFETMEAPPEVKALFHQPASGVLLRGLSEICKPSNGWRGLILAKYKRVLPYEFMSVLAYQPFYLCMYHYLFACMHGLQKPLPTWELQYNLWTLSMNGTNEERFSFMALKLRTAIFPRSTTGRVHGLPCENNGALEFFGVNLRDLGVKDQYDLADPEYARACAEIFHLTRDPNDMKDEDMADTPRTPNRPLKASVSSSPTVYKMSPKSPRGLSESMHTNNNY